MNYKIKTMLCFLLIFFLPMSNIVYAADYSQYSNIKICFGLGLNTNHTVPSGSRPSGVKIKDYNAYYYDIFAKDKDPVVYMTFDCGYYKKEIKKILKTLKEKNVKAAFFVTKNFIESKPGLVKKMKKQGHLVGNHTCSHPSLPSCSVKRIRQEIRDCQKTMKKLTGYKMDKIIRPPMGEYSVRVLKVLQDMGYSTFLWSLAYYDYDENNQPSQSLVMSKFKKHHFNGMIPLVHSTSKTNAETLPEILNYLEKQGYRFGTLDEIVAKQVKRDQKEQE